MVTDWPLKKRQGNWGRNASRNCFWDCYWGRAGQLLALVKFPEVSAEVNLTQSPSRQSLKSKNSSYRYGTDALTCYHVL